MSGLFSSPSPAPAPPPGPSPEAVAKQQEQEKQLDRQEQDRLREISSRRRARTSGGRRQLISAARLDPLLTGTEPTDTTLGPGSRNPDSR